MSVTPHRGKRSPAKAGASVCKTIHPGLPRYEGVVSPSDVFTTAKLMLCALVAVFPERWWPGIARSLARVHRRVRGSRSDRLTDVCSRFLRMEPSALELDVISAEYEENMAALRERMPGGWNRHLRLEGAHVVDEALRDGRGAVLWVVPCAFGDLATKKALWSAGYSIHHLSAVGHPFSPTRFGERILNPIRRVAENRYLASRVIVTYGHAQPALDLLRRELRANGTVTVTAIGAGRKVHAFGLFGGTVRLAAGAPRLAVETGAALIPVFTRQDNEGGLVVQCGPDLTAGELVHDGQETQQMASRLVSLIEAFVIDYPAAWQAWFALSWSPAPRDERTPIRNDADR